MNRRVGYVDAAAYLAVPVGTLRSMVSRKQVPHVRYSARTVVFDLDAIDAWLADKTIAARTVGL